MTFPDHGYTFPDRKVYLTTVASTVGRFWVEQDRDGSGWLWGCTTDDDACDTYGEEPTQEAAIAAALEQAASDARWQAKEGGRS